MLVLSVMLVHLLLLRLVDEAAAVVGTVFFCLMTPVARLGADALTDSTQLALFAGALYCLARWWRTEPIVADANDLESQISNLKSAGNASWLFLAGWLIGLAMLARPEAAILIPAWLLSIAWLQCSTDRPTTLDEADRRHGRACHGLWRLVQAPYAAATASFTGQTFAAACVGTGSTLPAVPRRSGRPQQQRLAHTRRQGDGVRHQGP